MNKTVDAIVVRLIASLVMCLSVVLVAGADSYVTFRDGTLAVFPDSCVASTSLDDGWVTFIAVDGTTYRYPAAEVESIDGTLQRELPSITSYRIRKKLNYQVVADAEGRIGETTVDVTVAGIGKWLTASFELSDERARAWVDGQVQHSGDSRLDLGQGRVYTVGYPGDVVLAVDDAGKCAMEPFGRQYVVTADFLTDHATTVPRIDINTADSADIVSKHEYLDALIVIDGAGVFPSMTDSVKVRGRGNTSWSANPAAKSPYRLKFASKVAPLGLTRGKNWVLIANKQYGSMLTNAYGMKAASLIGTVAPNHIIPVDLYINGTYKGNYNFTEKVGMSNNSVDLDNEDAATLLELDLYYDEAEGQKFLSTPRDIPVNVKFPDFGQDSTVITLDDIQRRFDALVAAVEGGEDLAPHVDIDQLARYLLANELICNKETFHPKSTYCYHENVLDGSSKFTFGPVWDLDWGCGYIWRMPESYFSLLTDYDYFNRPYNAQQYEFFRNLSRDKKVSRRMYEIWSRFVGDGLEELCDYCGDYYRYAAPSLTASMTAYPDSADYAGQASRAPGWFRARAALMLDRLEKANPIDGDVNGDGEVNIGDINALIDVILSREQSPVADVNRDGEVNVADVLALIDMLLSPP